MEAKQKEKEEMEYLRNELYHEEHEAELVRACARADRPEGEHGYTFSDGSCV